MHPICQVHECELLFHESDTTGINQFYFCEVHVFWSFHSLKILAIIILTLDNCIKNINCLNEICNYSFSISIGLCGSFCTPCLVYRNAEDLNKSGILYCLLGCFMPCIPLLLLRSEAREKYGIEVCKLLNYFEIWLLL